VKSSPLQLQRNILRFLTIFETQLKTYDEHFNNDYYQMSYVVHRCLFTGDFTVETTMTIWNKKYFFNKIETTYQFLSSLKSFCAVFSIQDVRIVRQLKKPTNHMLNLEERLPLWILMLRDCSPKDLDVHTENEEPIKWEKTIQNQNLRMMF
jgi:hypothetical protein